MRINNIRFKHHKVLGDTSIDLCGKKRSLSNGGKQNHDDMIIELSNPSHNTFTFFIGDNGVGKSVIFRSIVDFSNAFLEKSDNDDRINEYNRLTGEDIGLSVYRGFNELLYDFNILNFFNSKQFLKNNNMYLVYVSSAINEGDVFGSSERYCEISFSGSIQTKIMLAKAFRNNSENSRCTLLQYLNKSSSIWKQSLAISHYGWNNKEVTLAIKNGISLLDVRNLFNNLEICRYNTNYLDDNSFQVLRVILSTRTFKQYYTDPDCDKTINQILKDFVNASLYEQLKSRLSLLSSGGRILGSKNSLGAVGINLRVKNEVTASAVLKEIFDVKELNEEDFLIMLVLMEMGLLDLDITCGETPVERMSSGEQMLIRLYALFANLPQNFEKRNLVMLYDEPEISLHPKWQQQFPEYFRIIAEDIYNVTSSHFIFATHSPIIIMKSFFKKGDVNVVKLYREDNTTKSISIKDVHRYSIEELLMDDFSLEYRQPQQDLQLKKILDRENNRRIDDRSGCILGYDELRNEIERIYDNLTQKGS